MFQNGITKKTRYSYKGTMDDGTPPSYSDSKMASEEKKNCLSTFGKKLKYIVILLKIRMMHCLRIGKKRPAFLIGPSKIMLNFEVDRLSLQQLEYEMYCTDFPVDYNFL